MKIFLMTSLRKYIHKSLIEMRATYTIALLAATALAQKQPFTIGSERQIIRGGRYKEPIAEEKETPEPAKLVVGNREDSNSTAAMFENLTSAQESRIPPLWKDLEAAGDRNATDVKKDDGHVTVLKR